MHLVHREPWQALHCWCLTEVLCILQRPRCAQWRFTIGSSRCIANDLGVLVGHIYQHCKLFFRFGDPADTVYTMLVTVRPSPPLLVTVRHAPPYPTPPPHQRISCHYSAICFQLEYCRENMYEYSCLCWQTHIRNEDNFCVQEETFVCLFPWRYNPLWLYFSQSGSGL